MGEQAGTIATRTIEVDSNTSMLLDLLQDKLSAEPPVPDDERHMGARYTELARVHEQWQRECDALRMLCGVRLVDRAIG
jgi:hypothetical protein